MKIKTKQKLNLPELIKHVWENPVREKMIFHGSHDQRVVFDDVGNFYPSGYAFSDDSLFTVEVEEELTEDTVFDELAFVYDDYAHRPSSGAMVHKSIHDILNHKSPIYKIYALVNRSLVLIWSAEHGTPTEGTLEL